MQWYCTVPRRSRPPQAYFLVFGHRLESSSQFDRRTGWICQVQKLAGYFAGAGIIFGSFNLMLQLTAREGRGRPHACERSLLNRRMLKFVVQILAPFGRSLSKSTLAILKLGWCSCAVCCHWDNGIVQEFAA
jgi:hypothetical protein